MRRDNASQPAPGPWLVLAPPARSGLAQSGSPHRTRGVGTPPSGNAGAAQRSPRSLAVDRHGYPDHEGELRSTEEAP